MKKMRVGLGADVASAFAGTGVALGLVPVSAAVIDRERAAIATRARVEPEKGVRRKCMCSISLAEAA